MPKNESTIPSVPIGEQMLLPCAIEWNGETFGPGSVTITTASMRRALERAIENSGYDHGQLGYDSDPLKEVS